MTTDEEKQVHNVETERDDIDDINDYLELVGTRKVSLVITDYQNADFWDITKKQLPELRQMLHLFAASYYYDRSETYQLISEFQDIPRAHYTPPSTELLISKIELLRKQAQKPIDDEAASLKTLSETDREIYETIKEDQVIGSLERAMKSLAYLKEIRTGKVSINNDKY